MSGAIVTARVTQEQYAQINQLVSDGIFGSRSEVIQTFVKLGLKHCNFENREVTAEYKTRALAVAQKISVYNLVKSIITELSSFIELKQKYSIVDSLTNVEDLSMQLSANIYQELMKALKLEPVYQVAQRMAKEE